MIMLGLVAAALALLLGLIALQNAQPALPGEACMYNKSALDSIEIPGLELDSFFEADGIFEGEKNSETTTCVPDRELNEKTEVESVGITEFNLEGEEYGAEIIRTFTSFVPDNEIDLVDLFDQQVAVTESIDSRSVGYIWQDRLQVFYVVVSGDFNAIDPDLDDEEKIEAYMTNLRKCGLETISAIIGDE
jgi:hypothetical protein